MSKLSFKLAVVIFLLTRVLIFLNPPPYYSDVTADYERYANMWRYGLTPYLKHLYEYPPATIPLLSIPLELDQRGIGKYYPNYRFQIMVIDIIFFGVLAWAGSKISWTKKRLPRLLLGYALLTVLAKDFYYDGIDLAYTATIITSVLIISLANKDKLLVKIGAWLFFWLSTAIKFLTLPLLLPLALIAKSDLKKDLVAVGVGLVLIWGGPLLLYRSSLSVSFVHNNARPIKYASLPAHLIRGINLFSHTEEQVQKAPDFEYVGPVSQVVTELVKVIFPLSIVIVLIWASWWFMRMEKLGSVSKLNQLWNRVWSWLFKTSGSISIQARERNLFYLLRVYGVYVLTLFFTAKIFSQPFHIWYFPLLILFPFSKKLEKWAWGSMFLLVLMDQTTWLHLPADLPNWVGNRPAELIHYFRDMCRYLPMAVIIYSIAKARLPKVTQLTKSTIS